MKRRSFSIDYKSRILLLTREMKSAGRGGISAFLREEGLSTSHLTAWKKQAALDRSEPAKRGRPIKSQDALKREIRALRRNLAAMQARALQAEGIVRVQMEYVKGASLKLERRDRGLLSELISRVRMACPVSTVCEALALSRKDFYRTIKPLMDKGPASDP